MFSFDLPSTVKSRKIIEYNKIESKHLSNVYSIRWERRKDDAADVYLTSTTAKQLTESLLFQMRGFPPLPTHKQTHTHIQPDAHVEL